MRKLRSIVAATSMVILLASGCSTMQARRWGLCAMAGSLVGGIAGGVIGNEIEDEEGSSERGPAIAGGVLGGMTLGAIAGHLICDPVVEAPKPQPVAQPAPPPPAPPPPPPPPAGTKLVTLRGPNFDFDKAAIRPDGKMLLDEAVKVMKENPTLRVAIEGHTDSAGSDAYNQKLSERRATAASEYLVQQGIDTGRMTIRGYGESKPAASNDTESGRAENRRVEIIAE